MNATPTNGQRHGDQLEEQIARVLQEKLPCCYLARVPVFRADAAILPHEMANELDFILHLQNGRKHTLLIVECKSCRITGPEDNRAGFHPVAPKRPWIAHYPGSDAPQKDIKEQLARQRQALLTNLEPLDGELHVAAIVVASQAEGLKPDAQLRYEEPTLLEVTLVTPGLFAKCLDQFLAKSPALRVQQSEILRRIRCGQPVPALGHPEIYHAIEYTRRCRSFIDSEIFHHLELTRERWAINGSAGMGKSVLLIYAAMVLITDRTIHSLKGELRILQSFTEDALKANLPPLEERRVWITAHTAKQRDTLQDMFERFVALYAQIDPYNEFRRVKPEFRVFSEISDIGCNILLVDEAHDLDPDSENRIRQWYEKGDGRYLVIACDRHQKLRLSKDATRMIEGINFSRCTKKLNRNYRNPFATYAASLGLLFRWFAPAGPKIIPDPITLQDSFGFEDLHQEAAGNLFLHARNDAHPANNWSHLVASFPSPDAAFRQLSEFPLKKEHVLWVRFSPEAPDFNYENLQRWSYHSVFGSDAPELLNKYVKGQEFPIVVVEGLPEFFSWATVSSHYHEDSPEARRQMWLARRLVYLAASRANVFLYFILPPDLNTDLQPEFTTLFRQLSEPPSQWTTAGKRWEIQVLPTPETEKLSVYLDQIEAEPATVDVTAPAPERTPTPIPPPSTAPEPVSVQTTVAPPTPPASLPTPKLEQPPTSPGPKPPADPTRERQLAPMQPTPVPPPTPPSPKEPTRVTVAQLARRIGLPVNIALEALRNRGFPNLKDNRVVNAMIAEQLRTAKAEYDRQRPLQPIRFPEAKPSESQSITDFIQKNTDHPQ
jgi:hypothetical protein